MMIDPLTQGWEPCPLGGLPPILGPFWMRREGEAIAYAFAATEGLCNYRGVIHGGMLATFMDHTLGLVTREATGGVPIATIQLDLQYLAAGQPGTLVEGRGEVVRQTASVVFLRGTLVAGGTTLVSATGIWKVLSRSR